MQVAREPGKMLIIKPGRREAGLAGCRRGGVMRSDPASAFTGLYEPCPCPRRYLELIPDVAGSCLGMSSSHSTRYCGPYANSLGVRWCFAAAQAVAGGE